MQTHKFFPNFFTIRFEIEKHLAQYGLGTSKCFFYKELHDHLVSKGLIILFELGSYGYLLHL